LDNAVVEGGIQPGGFDPKYEQGEILLPPGDRADVVAAIPAAATGTATMWTEDYARVGMSPGFTDTPTVPVMHLAVSGLQPQYVIGAGTPLRAQFAGQAVETLGAATGGFLNPAAFTPPKTGLSSQNIKLTATPGGGAGFGIDNLAGHHDETIDYTQVAK